MISSLKLRAAFSLIELLIVVAIIAILAAIAVPNFLDAHTRAKTSRAKSDLRTIALGLDAYALDHNRYPSMIGPVGLDEIYRGEPSKTGHNIDRNWGWRTVPPSLTTPVAYLSTYFTDIFKKGGKGRWEEHEGKPYDSGNIFDMGYVYFNISDCIRGGGWSLKNLEYYGHWRIFSLGPDKMYNLPFGLADPTLGWMYDPTNGTISSGCILRTARMSDPLPPGGNLIFD